LVQPASATRNSADIGVAANVELVMLFRWHPSRWRYWCSFWRLWYK